MLEYAKKVQENILAELENLRLCNEREDFSSEQRRAFIQNSIQQLEYFFIQWVTIMECLTSSRQSSAEITGSTSLIIPVDSKLQYTGSKVGLTEVIYSFANMGLFNYGKAGVKMLIDYFEKVFFVDLGNYTATFQDIRNRKTGNTKFIDSMRDSLEAWIDRLD